MLPSPLGQGVAAAADDQPHAQQIGGFELAIDDALAGFPRETILVVEGGGAAMLDQLGHGDHGRVVEAVLAQLREDRIDPVQPFDQRQPRPVEIGPVAHETLEEMVMRVDQAGIDEPPCRIDNRRSRPAAEHSTGRLRSP